MPDELHLDQETHTYTVGDTVYPSVTQIIKAAGLIDDEWFNEEARERGELVHIATALYDRGQLNWEKVPDEIRGYVLGWIKFREESKCKIVSTERQFNSGFGYCGTIDREITLNGRLGILDIKTGQPQAWHGVQLGGYRIGSGLHGVKTFSLYLSNRGTYKLVETRDEPEGQMFHAALNLYQYKKRNGLL